MKCNQKKRYWVVKSGRSWSSLSVLLVARHGAAIGLDWCQVCRYYPYKQWIPRWRCCGLPNAHRTRRFLSKRRIFSTWMYFSQSWGHLRSFKSVVSICDSMIDLTYHNCSVSSWSIATANWLRLVIIKRLAVTSERRNISSNPSTASLVSKQFNVTAGIISYQISVSITPKLLWENPSHQGKSTNYEQISLCYYQKSELFYSIDKFLFLNLTELEEIFTWSPINAAPSPLKCIIEGT